MPTPSGQISLNDVNVELGLAGTTLITMNDANVRTLAGVGGSGTPISMQNLQNKSNRVTASATISANTVNYVLNTDKAPGYSAGKTDMTLTINPGVFVSSASTGSYALNVDTSWSPGDTIVVVNNGTIQGRGGNGGSPSRSPGFNGGPALIVSRAISLNNLNRIAGGGGGGGAGGNCVQQYKQGPLETGVGGGGGGGLGGSIGGPRSQSDYAISEAGQPGTLTSAGNGGNRSNYQSGSGGGGGTYASSGGDGGRGGFAESNPGGSGGGGGGAIVGNSNITYINTGTINGSINN